MANENLEELIRRNRFHIDEREIEILRRFSRLYPEEIHGVISEMNARKATSLGYEEDTDVSDVTRLSLPFLTFLDDNLDVLAALPAGLGELVVGKMVRGSQLCYEHQELQDFFGHLAAFCRADNGYSIEGKKDVLLAASDSAGPEYMDFVTMVVNLYAGWQGMLHAEGGMNEVGARLLQELAPSYRIPVPDGAGRLRPTEPGQEKIRPGWIDKNGYYDLHWIQANSVQLSGAGIQNYSMTDIVQFLLERIRAKKSLNPDSIEEVFNELSGLLDIECESGNLGEAAECANLNKELAGSGYRIRRKIAAGTFKDVYLAEAPDGNECILKRMRNERVKEIMKGKISEMEMVKKELKSSAFQMSHPNISPTMPLFHNKRMYILERKYERTLEDFVKEAQQEGIVGMYITTDDGEIDGEWYCDQLPEKTFGHYVRTADPEFCYYMMPAVAGEGKDYVLLHPYATQMIKFAADMVTALYHCHEKRGGMVHGDIKTDNVGIVIEKDGEEIAVINDFGMATYDSEVYGGDYLRRGLGRVYTKPPQLFREGSHPTKMTDAWSFGAVLFFLVTGRYPFSEGYMPEDYSLPETRQKYLERVHALIREGKTKEVLRENIKKYLPHGIEIPFNLENGPYCLVERISGYTRYSELDQIMEFCFGTNTNFSFGDEEHPFNYIKREFNWLQKRIKKREDELNYADSKELMADFEALDD